MYQERDACGWESGGKIYQEEMYMRGHWDSLRTAIHTHRHSNSKSCDTGNCLPYMLSIIDECTYVYSLEE